MVGVGIAGASVAYFLSLLGVRVTVVDAGVHAASQVPSALLNPVRGQSGMVAPRLLEGMGFTWALVRELITKGFEIPHGQDGIYRPVPDAKTRAKFERNLPAALKHEWLEPGEVPALAPGWHSILYIPEGGWVDGAAFCTALLRASGAEIISGKARNDDGKWVIDDGEELFSITHHPSPITIFCGGSIGSTWAGETATHRAGSMLLLDRPVTTQPLSFGAYLSPTAAGGTLGGTFETPSSVWREPELPLESLRWLLGKGEALADLSSVQVTGRWAGTRLSGLRHGRGEDGVWRLTGLSSKGFLLGPLLGRELAGQVARHAGGDGLGPVKV